MKKSKLQMLIACILILTMTVCLFAGCDKKEEEKASKSDDKQDSEQKEDEEPASEDTGTVYDTGAMKLTVAPGWKAFPVADVFAEEADATNPNALSVIKGGKSDADTFTKPYIYITYFDPDTYGVAPDKEFYDDVVDLEPIELENHTYTGFSCTSFGYELSILWLEEGEHQFQVAVYTNQEDGQISLTDEDLLSMLNSLSPTVTADPTDPTDDANDEVSTAD